MLEGIDLDQRIEYSCKGDTENPTVFIFKPLDGFEMLRLSEYVKTDVVSLGGDYVREMLSLCVIEVKNPDLTKSGDIEKFISMQDVTTLTELTFKAMRVNKLMDDEAKN